MKLAFISDLHLSPDTPHNNHLLFQLLEKWQHEVHALYILGDFFDYYLGDDDNSEFNHNIKKALLHFTHHKPAYFIGGNHDFAVSHKFAHETGVQLLKDLTTIQAGDKTILLSHGDTFCTLDIKYQRMKKILRNPFLVFLLRRTPLSWRYKLKEKLENKSAETFNSEPDKTYQVVDNTIAEIAEKHHASIVIHGHTHRPGKYLIQNGSNTIERYEIPDWADRPGGGYILLDQNTFIIHDPAQNNK